MSGFLKSVLVVVAGIAAYNLVVGPMINKWTGGGSTSA